MKNIRKGLTFDDVLLEPRSSTVSPTTADVHAQLCKGVTLDIPIISAAMDTLTESKMAIAIAQEGGIGVIHRNCTVAQQVVHVKKVKAKNCVVGAAVGPHDIDRAIALDKAGTDVIFTDCAHAHKPDIIASVKKIKKAIKGRVIVGNIATAEAARAFVSFVDGLKVGIGPGSICTTRIVSGVGVPQLTAIMDIVSVAKAKKVPVIADGGIKHSGDIVKALAGGASSVMLGSMLSGAEETPGKTITLDGKKYKEYRGMGSMGAMQGGKSSDRYFQSGQKKYVPEGVEAVVECKGSVKDIIYQLVGGLKSGMGYIGAPDIKTMSKQGYFVEITGAGLYESHPHSVTIHKEAPNYSN